MLTNKKVIRLSKSSEIVKHPIESVNSYRDFWKILFNKKLVVFNAFGSRSESNFDCQNFKNLHIFYLDAFFIMCEHLLSNAEIL